MNNWQIQSVKDQIDFIAWSLLNASDPAEQLLKQASVKLNETAGFLNISTDRLLEASEILKGTPMHDKLLSFINSIEDIEFCIRALKNKYERGERE